MLWPGENSAGPTYSSYVFTWRNICRHTWQEGNGVIYFICFDGFLWLHHRCFHSSVGFSGIILEKFIALHRMPSARKLFASASIFDYYRIQLQSQLWLIFLTLTSFLLFDRVSFRRESVHGSWKFKLQIITYKSNHRESPRTNGLQMKDLCCVLRPDKSITSGDFVRSQAIGSRKWLGRRPSHRSGCPGKSSTDLWLNGISSNRVAVAVVCSFSGSRSCRSPDFTNFVTIFFK